MCVSSGVASIKKKNLDCLSALGGQTLGRSALPSVGSYKLGARMHVIVTGGICLSSGRSIFERCGVWGGHHPSLVCGVMVWPKRVNSVNSVLKCLNTKVSACWEGVLGISLCYFYIVSSMGLI